MSLATRRARRKSLSRFLNMKIPLTKETKSLDLRYTKQNLSQSKFQRKILKLLKSSPMFSKRNRQKPCNNYLKESTVKRISLGANNSLLQLHYIPKEMKMETSKTFLQWKR